MTNIPKIPLEFQFMSRKQINNLDLGPAIKILIANGVGYKIGDNSGIRAKARDLLRKHKQVTKNQP